MPAALEITGMTTTNQPMLDTHSQQVSNFANNDSDMSGMTMNNNNNDSSIMTSPNGPMLRAQYGPPAPPKAAPVDIPAYTMSHADISAQLKIYRSNTTLLNPSRYLNRLIRRPGYFGPLMLWWVRDWGGLICSVFTWFLVVFGEVTFTVLILASQDPISAVLHGLFNYTCAWLGIIAHLRAMFTDPGAVPRGNATEENLAKLNLKEGEVIFKCPKCVSFKPSRTHHCSVCRRCIKKMDHHCPWVNNCIGENNQKFFVLFTFYICMISCHALYLSIHYFITCMGQDWRECTSFSPAATTVFLIFLLFESLLFGIFTAIMCGTQLSAICSDETGIESLKGGEATWEKKSRWMSIKDVFGHPFSILWFSPFHSVSQGKEELYQYTV